MLFNKENLLNTFQSMPDNVSEYIKNIPCDLLDRKRTEDSWTIREHIYHIVSVQEMLYLRILNIKNEENPVITPYFPENEKDIVTRYDSISEALGWYKECRQKQSLLINQLSESDLEKEAKHDEYILYNIPIMINHMIFHEYWHLYRIEELWLTRDESFK
ncbi:MAG: DinB family protein [Bacillota bacterium]|nr:DinB family protein [Bacillota bacterium]